MCVFIYGAAVLLSHEERALESWAALVQVLALLSDSGGAHLWASVFSSLKWEWPLPTTERYREAK